MLLMLFAAIQFLSLSTSAQTNDGLDFSIEAAKKSLLVSSTELKNEINKSEGFDACTAKILKFKKKNDEWFVNHAQAFRAIETSYLQAFRAAKGKVEELKSRNFEVNPVKGQKDSQNINLPKLIDYFKNYNGRLRTCPPEKLEELKEAQNDPDLNPLGVSHEQVLSAMSEMVIALNASLKEGGYHYSIEFNQKGNSYDLQLLVDFGISNSTQVRLKTSFLDSGVDLVAPSPAEVWSKLLAEYGSALKIDRYPIDGALRLKQIYSENLGGECSLPGWEMFDFDSTEKTVFLAVDFINEKVKANASALELDLSKSVPRTPSPDIQFLRDFGGRSCEKFTHLRLLVVDGELWDTEKCLLRSAASVKIFEQKYVFAINVYDTLFVYRGIDRQVEIDLKDAPLQILYASNYQNKAAVTYFSVSGKVITVDYLGNVISIRKPVQAPREKSGPSIRFLNDFGDRTCSKRYLLVVNDELWDQDHCYSGHAKGVRYFGVDYVFLLSNEGSIKVYVGAADRLELNVAAEQIRSAQITDGVPSVTFLDSSGQVREVTFTNKSFSSPSRR